MKKRTRARRGKPLVESFLKHSSPQCTPTQRIDVFKETALLSSCAFQSDEGVITQLSENLWKKKVDMFTDAATGDVSGFLMDGCDMTTVQCVDARALRRFIRFKFIFHFKTES